MTDNTSIPVGKTDDRTQSEAFRERLSYYQQRVDEALLTFLPSQADSLTRLSEAMRYSVTNGGKRVRPILAYSTGVALQIPIERVDVAACSLEMLHAY